MRVAHSNEAFELWYLLLFGYLQSGLERTRYYPKLSGHLGREYKKNCATMYADLRSRQPTAIRNAARLLTIYSPHNPEKDNPSTSVHELVQELNSRRRD